MDGALEPARRQTALLPVNASPPCSRIPGREGGETGQVALSVADVSGGVSYGTDGDAEGWRPARVGLAVAKGDRLYVARGGSLDLRTAGFEIHLASGAGLEALALTEDVKQFYVWGGSAGFLVRALQPSESFGVDSPTAVVTFASTGNYRIDVDREGSTQVAVDRGSARVSSAGIAVPLGSGDVVKIDGIRCPAHECPSLQLLDSRESEVEALPRRVRDRTLLFQPRRSH